MGRGRVVEHERGGEVQRRIGHLHCAEKWGLLPVLSGAVQRAPVPVRQAGRGGVVRPAGAEAPVRGGLRDHPGGRPPALTLPQALPGVGPPAPGEGHRDQGRHRPPLPAPHGGGARCLPARLQPLQSQLR